MRDLAPCHPGRPGLVRVALAPCSPPLSPVGCGPASGDGSGGERTRADESWGSLERCSVALDTVRTRQSGRTHPWHGSCQDSATHSILSRRLSLFSFPSSWSKKRGRGACVPQHMKEMHQRHKTGSRVGGERRDAWLLRSERRRGGNGRNACTVPIDETHPQRNPCPITACRSSAHLAITSSPPAAAVSGRSVHGSKA